MNVRRLWAVARKETLHIRRAAQGVRIRKASRALDQGPHGCGCAESLRRVLEAGCHFRLRNDHAARGNRYAELEIFFEPLGIRPVHPNEHPALRSTSRS